MRVHFDGRRRFVGDLFGREDGDFNAVTLFPGVVIAWHRHQFQDDGIYALYGNLTIQAIDLEGIRHRWDLDAPHALPIFIPRGWWHGYSTVAGATILSFNGPRKWDGTDEERHPIDAEMPWIS
jgi:quercetin dioxygenase-like cupin family protein